MKTATLLLTASLAANVVLTALYVTRTNSSPALSPAATNAPAGPPTTANTDALRTALASGDAAALQAAGLSPELARQIAFARTMDKLVARTRAVQGGTTGQWWRNRASPLSREQQAKARREIAEAFAAAYGDDPGWFTPMNQPALDFLSTDKRAALRRITQDYDEMLAKFSADGFQLPSDREKQKLLQSERDRDIAALLSPDELAEYQMRTSSTAANIRRAYGDAIASEDEFRKIYALQKAFDDQNPAPNGRVTMEQMQQRAAAAQQLQADLRAAVGDEAYASLRRASDTDLRTVDALATRLNLPANTTDTVATLRDTYAAQSQQISGNASVPLPDRRTELQGLAAQAKADLTKTLGREGAEAYSQRSPWVSMLQGGLGFSTTPPPNSPAMSFATGTTPGVYPMPPVGGAAAGATRQVFNYVSGDAVGGGGGNAGGGSGTVMFSSGTPMHESSTTQVISVMSTERSVTPPQPAAATPSPTPPAPK